MEWSLLSLPPIEMKLKMIPHGVNDLAKLTRDIILNVEIADLDL